MNREAKIWRDRFYSLKRWVKENLNVSPAYRTEYDMPDEQPAHRHVRKDMDLL